MRNAKIVCTLGPASDDRETVRALTDAGMSVARLNASHGTTDERRRLLERVRDVGEAVDDPPAAMVDLRGPEVRTAETDEPVELEASDEVRFVEGEAADADVVGLTHSVAAADPGDAVLLDDGDVETTVERVDGETVHARVDSGGAVDSRAGVNVPGVDLGLELVDEDDRRELEAAAESGVDFVAASFVADADDVYEVADVLEEHGGGDVAVVAKIERAAAVENVAGIVEAADGVMVARGDLGVECPLEDVPLVQKRIVRRCVARGVPVVTATEMLDSMVHAPRPTRAETSDVANAVLDGTDAVMLSGETAVGDHPVRTVETMARIVRRIEASEEYADTREARVPEADPDVRTDALARSARYLARDVGAAAVVAFTESGYTARKAAKFRPGVPVVAATPDEAVRRQLALSWGVEPRYAARATGVDGVLETAVDAALEAGVADSGDTIVVLSGMTTGLPGTDATNTLKVHVAAETVATGRAVVGGQAAGPLVRLEGGAADLSGVPGDAVLAVPASFDGEFEPPDRVGAVVAAGAGTSGRVAARARELGVPMVAGATLPTALEEGTVVTVDGERGVVYDGDVTRDR